MMPFTFKIKRISVTKHEEDYPVMLFLLLTWGLIVRLQTHWLFK